MQVCVSVFSLSGLVYKVLNDDAQRIANILKQIAQNWVDPVVLHQDLRLCCMVRSMLPCQYNDRNGPAAGPVPGEKPRETAVSRKAVKRSAPEESQALKAGAKAAPLDEAIVQAHGPGPNRKASRQAVSSAKSSKPKSASRR
uniref:Uncharacterized protein n=1 Tax=Cryptomonas curvata TaxID=233186 RepID=A0A7S0QRF2_9CRYP|mmetsp:Transcript_47468/g.99276  ORF Transcript_47468/g.99276 Transcript_47468/m.99276 type:complete len:142 (+) Transcript_47468:1-426(+)